jgi:transposase InsO family protein
VICRVLGVARSTSYYQEHDRMPIVDDVLAQRIKHLIDAEPYLGYRMVWTRLRRQGLKINRKAVQRLMQLKGRQCHRRLKKRCSPRRRVIHGNAQARVCWQHRFETYDEAKSAITAWVTHYNESRPHSRLDYLPPAEWRSRQAELSA